MLTSAAPFATATDLFEGPDGLRVRGETRSLWTCLLFAPLTVAAASLIFPSVSISEFVLLVVVGLVFVSLSRGRLLGSSVRIEGRQLPEIADVAARVAARMGVAAPLVFVRDDPFVPIASMGVGEPYALVISSQYYAHLEPGELAFLIARELAHVAAGHTRITSLLSTSGRENPLVAIVFGAWLRKTEYTADRAAYLFCSGLDDGLGGIAIATFHSIGRRVDMQVLAEQRRDLDAQSSLRMGEWVSAAPYATSRLDALRSFAQSPLCARWRERFAGAEMALPAAEPVAPPSVIEKRDCAPLLRRLAAMAIDLATVIAILRTPFAVEASKTAIKATDLKDVPRPLLPLLMHLPAISLGGGTVVTLFALFVYSAVLVALSGQTLGMLVMELRVVTTSYRHPTFVQSFWRYTAAFITTITMLAAIGFLVRVHPHDRVSRTRLVRGRRHTRAQPG